MFQNRRIRYRGWEDEEEQEVEPGTGDLMSCICRKKNKIKKSTERHVGKAKEEEENQRRVSRRREATPSNFLFDRQLRKLTDEDTNKLANQVLPLPS